MKLDRCLRFAPFQELILSGKPR